MCAPQLDKLCCLETLRLTESPYPLILFQMSPLPLYLLALFAVAVQSLPSPQEDGYVGP